MSNESGRPANIRKSDPIEIRLDYRDAVHVFHLLAVKDTPSHLSLVRVKTSGPAACEDLQVKVRHAGNVFGPFLVLPA